VRTRSDSIMPTRWDRARSRVYGLLAGSERVGRLAVHVRRAATLQIRHRLVASLEADKNGEWWLISVVAPQVKTVFDVGANVGSWAEEVVRRCPHLDSLSCFEPSEVAAVRTEAAIGDDPRVRVVRAAVSDTEGTMLFHERPDASQTSSLISRDDQSGTGRAVRVVTIDQEMERLSLDHLDLLKIDVEGYDLHALRGAQAALKRQAIAFVQFEYNQPWMYAGSTLQAAGRLLDECGYELFLLNSSGLCRCDVGRLGELFAYLNFVAIPRGRVAQLPVKINPDPLWG
jgi:FkbM family methyltransferase